ncbi:MAG: phytanoyl-CoA dioxygenase family protein [Gammaproteobacteria bacterium]|nr:phytanoyl-CoA dioxygenase family protein [Gammaproteobacteria bacterium]
MHRDKSVPVLSRVDVEGWSGWSRKEGVDFVQPPREFMDSLVAVRLSIDPDQVGSGSLVVVPGSHLGVDSGSPVPVPVGRGGALVFSPSLLHKSSRIERGQRRVLHFLFAPSRLPGGLQWAYAA